MPAWHKIAIERPRTSNVFLAQTRTTHMHAEHYNKSHPNWKFMAIIRLFDWVFNSIKVVICCCCSSNKTKTLCCSFLRFDCGPSKEQTLHRAYRFIFCNNFLWAAFVCIKHSEFQISICVCYVDVWIFSLANVCTSYLDLYIRWARQTNWIDFPFVNTHTHTHPCTAGELVINVLA